MAVALPGDDIDGAHAKLIIPTQGLRLAGHPFLPGRQFPVPRSSSDLLTSNPLRGAEVWTGNCRQVRGNSNGRRRIAWRLMAEGNRRGIPEHSRRYNPLSSQEAVMAPVDWILKNASVVCLDDAYRSLPARRRGRPRRRHSGGGRGGGHHRRASRPGKRSIAAAGPCCPAWSTPTLTSR